MEPEVDVVLRTSLPNNTWSRRQFRQIKLKIERDAVQRRVKYLVIGRTSQNVKLKLTSNIREIFQNWLDSSGKVTLRFKKPPIDCLIHVSSFTARNTSFLRDTLEQIKLSSRGEAVSVPPRPQILPEHHDQWKLLQRQFQLPNEKLFLTVLDLSGRQLTSLPVQLGDLRLVLLNLSQNDLGKGHWTWLYGNVRNSLNILILDDNKLVRVPSVVASCKALHILSLANNDIEWIPPLLLIPCTSQLRELKVSNNARLRALPHPSRTLEKLDIVGCTGLSAERPPRVRYTGSWPGIQLKHLAGEAVLRERIPYGLDNLPRELADYLDSSCQCDRCRRLIPKPKFYTFIPDGSTASLQTIASGRNSSIYSQYFLCSLCSPSRWRGTRDDNL